MQSVKFRKDNRFVGNKSSSQSDDTAILIFNI